MLEISSGKITAFSLIGAMLLMAATVAGAPLASADDTTCTGIISSGSLDNVIVPSGDCVLTGSVVVDGNVKQTGGNLKVDGIPVGGNVQAEGGGTTEVLEATVEGSVQIKKTTGLAQVHDSIVGADIQVEEKNDGSIRVVSNDVEGNVQIWKNSGSSIILVEDNLIDGNLQCKENVPGPTVSGNTVAGDIECAGDSIVGEQSSETNVAPIEETTEPTNEEIMDDIRALIAKLQDQIETDHANAAITLSELIRLVSQLS